MHYYQFNIGDYAKSTAHLSDYEDLAYRRLLDLYYDSEKPIDLNIKKVCRLIRLKDFETETQAILDEFFKKTNNGYIQKRIKKEIDSYSAKSTAARANGKLGGRPKKTQSVNLANPGLTKVKPKQEPLNIKQEPLNTNHIITEATPPVATAPKFNFKNTLLELGGDSVLVDDWLKVRRDKKGSNTETALKGFLAQVDKSGKTLNEVLKYCTENSYKGFKADWLLNSDFQQQASNQTQAQNFQELHTNNNWAEGLT